VTSEIDLLSVFRQTIARPWITIGDQDVQLCIEQLSMSSLRITFQGTCSWWDIGVDTDFFAKPYKKMKKVWYAHSGFIRGYKSVNDYILTACSGMKQVEVRGYSLGAAYASLCFEDIKFNFPEMDLFGFIFGSPRVFWMPPKELKSRFNGLFSIAHQRDPVFLVPPVIFGYQHIGSIYKVGDKGFPLPKYHMMDSYSKTLDKGGIIL
jgi:hypothetical protein